ncbi:SIMPL domain-containing protein [Polyangium sp. 15x6]|uniref:SIMPL domain-containing protein n=1 Tax=Polyangium sp. 15x6 TaxID=3042687 RepID=UPI002499B1CB|nr:SIMPL domain-containing protein [Polyangium sp. 15x6]MDI3288163.1 SIMPL domain-containing protein [Polyangium sp. 15x6]
MKRLSILAPLAIGAALLFPELAQAQDETDSTVTTPDTRPRIIVTGDAEVHVVPDEVVLRIGIETVDMDLVKAKTENDNAVRAVLALARGMGIDDTDVDTDYISIAPKYEWQDDSNVFVGYAVKNTMAVTLDQVDKFEQFLMSAIQSDVNRVHGIEFRTTKLREHRDRARAMAIQAAREKAIALAKELDQTVGLPLLIDDGGSGWSSAYNAWWDEAPQLAQNVAVVAGGGLESSPESTLAPGQIAVRAKITVSFQLLPTR